MRWIGSVVVAACLVAAGAIRPAYAERPEPQAAELAAAAKALTGKVLPRRGAEPAPDQRRSAGSLLAVAPPAHALAPPRVTFLDAAPAASGVLPAPPRSPRSARGPPR